MGFREKYEAWVNRFQKSQWMKLGNPSSGLCLRTLAIIFLSLSGVLVPAEVHYLSLHRQCAHNIKPLRGFCDVVSGMYVYMLVYP